MGAARTAALAALMVLVLVAGGCGGDDGGEQTDPIEAALEAPDESMGMVLIVDGIELGGALPVKLTCDGKGVSPAMQISAVPKGTEELVLTMVDPDAADGEFFHWGVTGIDPATSEIAEDAIPDGAAESTNDAGGTGYEPACPPEGDPVHRYLFTLHALPDPSGIEAGASPDEVRAAVEDATAKAQSIAGYER